MKLYYTDIEKSGKMGKASGEKERGSVQQNLRETGLRLSAQKGIKGVSTQDLC